MYSATAVAGIAYVDELNIAPRRKRVERHTNWIRLFVERVTVKRFIRTLGGHARRMHGCELCCTLPDGDDDDVSGMSTDL